MHSTPMLLHAKNRKVLIAYWIIIMLYFSLSISSDGFWTTLQEFWIVLVLMGALTTVHRLQRFTRTNMYILITIFAGYMGFSILGDDPNEHEKIVVNLFYMFLPLLVSSYWQNWKLNIYTTLLTGGLTVYAASQKMPYLFPDWDAFTYVDVFIISGFFLTLSSWTNMKLNRKIEHMAYTDALTGLANRASFELTMRSQYEEAKEGEWFSVMIIDLDNFKKVNDTLGHDAGDILLREVANRVQASIRKDFDVASRMGGDEFAILLPRINQERDAEDVASRILESFQQPLEVNGTDIMSEFRVTGSIGVAIGPAHGKSPTQIYKAADVAMYHAKKNGKNKYKVYEEGLTEE